MGERRLENTFVVGTSIALGLGLVGLGGAKGVEYAIAHGPVHSHSNIGSDQGHAELKQIEVQVGQQEISGFVAHVDDGSAYQDSQSVIFNQTITAGTYKRIIQPDEVDGNGKVTTEHGEDVEVNLCQAGGLLPAEALKDESKKTVELTIHIPTSMLTYCTRALSHNYQTKTTGFNRTQDALNRDQRDKMYNVLDAVIDNNAQDLAVEKCAPLAWNLKLVRDTARKATAAQIEEGISLGLGKDWTINTNVFYGDESTTKPDDPTQIFPREKHDDPLSKYADSSKVTVVPAKNGVCEQKHGVEAVDANGNVIGSIPVPVSTGASNE